MSFKDINKKRAIAATEIDMLRSLKADVVARRPAQPGCERRAYTRRIRKISQLEASWLCWLAKFGIDRSTES